MNLDYIGCSYDEFPHSTAMSEGIQVLQAKADEPSCRTLCDVAYRNVDGKDLHLHIILPTQNKECKERFPCIVYVQGSAWRKQTTGRELAQLARFAKRGYVVGIVEYRDSSWAPFPAQIIDTKYAIMFMVEHSEQYFVDTNRLILWGDSSGAHTAMMSAFTASNPFFLETGIKEYPIRCVIDYYGPTNVALMNEEPSTQNHMEPDSPEGMLLGGQKVTLENAAMTVVMNYIREDKDIPPLLIVHGSKDRLVPFGQSVLLYDKMKSCKKDVTAYQLYGADHGEEPFWNHEVFDIVERFIKRNME